MPEAVAKSPSTSSPASAPVTSPSPRAEPHHLKLPYARSMARATMSPCHSTRANAEGCRAATPLAAGPPSAAALSPPINTPHDADGLLSFVLGFLLGLSPFADLDDSGLRPHDFSFDDDGGLPRRDLAALVRSRPWEIEIVRPEGLVAVELEARKEEGPGEPDLRSLGKLLIVVTPTYNRSLQSIADAAFRVLTTVELPDPLDAPP